MESDGRGRAIVKVENSRGSMLWRCNTFAIMSVVRGQRTARPKLNAQTVRSCAVSLSQLALWLAVALDSGHGNIDIAMRLDPIRIQDGSCISYE